MVEGRDGGREGRQHMNVAENWVCMCQRMEIQKQPARFSQASIHVPETYGT